MVSPPRPHAQADFSPAAILKMLVGPEKVADNLEHQHPWVFAAALRAVDQPLAAETSERRQRLELVVPNDPRGVRRFAGGHETLPWQR